MALGRRAHSPLACSRSTAWLVPPTVMTSWVATSWTRQSGVAATICRTSTAPSPTPTWSRMRASRPFHSIVWNRTRSSNTTRTDRAASKLASLLSGMQLS